MGLAAELDYRVDTTSGMRRAVAAVGSTRLVSAISNRVMRPIDRYVLKFTGGRSTATTWLTGIPTLWVTTTGARSGLPRTTPLLGIPVGDDLALLGTSFGQRATPAWVHNLEAHPRARVSYRAAEISIRARPATLDEASIIWAEAAEIYPGYASYQQWAAHREIRVFLLELDENDSGPSGVGSP